MKQVNWKELWPAESPAPVSVCKILDPAAELLPPQVPEWCIFDSFEISCLFRHWHRQLIEAGLLTVRETLFLNDVFGTALDHHDARMDEKLRMRAA